MRRAGEALRRWVPRWWRGEARAVGRVLHLVLTPAEHGFRAVSAARNAAYDRGWLRPARSRIPVISVGNISVGGAGKTPFTAWLAARLAENGREPAVVMRGYGADELAVHRELNPDIPVFAAARRIDGVAAAAAAGRRVAVLDDAFQHRAIHREVEIVLVSAESWSSRRHLLPRGPWRESGAALARADVVVITRKTAEPASAAAVAAECSRLARGVPVAVCRLAPTRIVRLSGEALPLGWLSGRRVLAVASLADPWAFVSQLEHLGADAELLAYPDHHDLTRDDLGRIRRRAAGRPVVCTRKEAVKLRPLTGGDDEAIVMLEQRVVLESGLEAIERAVGGIGER